MGPPREAHKKGPAKKQGPEGEASKYLQWPWRSPPLTTPLPEEETESVGTDGGVGTGVGS